MSRDINTDRQLVQSVWPEWELMERIGGGQFGIVYKARKHGFAGDSLSAIKVVSIERDADDREFSVEQTDSYLAGIAQNYAREIKVMESVKGYSNIVNIEDYTVCQNSGGKPWFVLIRMELLRSLYDDLDGKEITDQLVIRIGKDLCQALEICSERQIVHRDIKPENVLVNDNGVYKLADFGVARQITRYTSNTKTGTPDYMAPEIYNRTLKAADFDRVHSADIYSLGMLLYWIGNGRKLPFVEHGRISTPEEKYEAFLRKMDGEKLPPPIKVSPSLQNVILKACAFDPKDRYKSAGELREALESVSVIPSKSPKHRWITVLIAAFLVLLVAFVLEYKEFIDITDLIPPPTVTPIWDPPPEQTTLDPETTTPTPETTTPEPEPTTPEPESTTPTPTPTQVLIALTSPPTLQTSTILPLSDYEGVSAKLKVTSNKMKKIRIYSGPDEEYREASAFDIELKNKNEATAFFVENGYAFTHFTHKSPKPSFEVYGYIAESVFQVGELEGMPVISELPYVERTVKSDAIPLKGPGTSYEEWDGLTISQGALLKCYFEENGYCFVERDTTGKPFRAWVPADCLEE